MRNGTNSKIEPGATMADTWYFAETNMTCVNGIDYCVEWRYVTVVVRALGFQSRGPGHESSCCSCEVKIISITPRCSSSFTIYNIYNKYLTVASLCEGVGFFEQYDFWNELMCPGRKCNLS